jgi:predicted GNAT family N-acyltransferase
MNFILIFINDSVRMAEAFQIRRKVFIEEQKVPEADEFDQYDLLQDTRHVLLLNEDGAAVGTARFRPCQDKILKVERVAVLPKWRNSGAGRMMLEAISREAEKASFSCIKLGAQVQAKGFYECLGYQVQGNVFIEAGIEHVTMIKTLPGKKNNI